jgi:hypothetical protein
MITNVVFLDTQVLDQANFDLGSEALTTLIRFVKAGRIELHLSQITDGEIRKKIRDRVKGALKLLEPIRNNRDIAVIRALGRAGVIRADALTLRQQDIEDPLLARYEEFLREGNVAVEPIAGGNNELRAVFTDYFNVRPPFENRAEKKHEFPDAFAAVELALWCAANEKAAYLISGDKGMGDVCAGIPSLHWLPSVDVLADLVVSSEDEWLANRARDWFAAAQWYTVGQVISRLLELKLVTDDPAADPRLVMPEPDDVRIQSPTVLEIARHGERVRARISARAEIQYQAVLLYDDVGAPFYEDDPLEIATGHARAAQTAYIRIVCMLEFDPRTEIPQDTREVAPVVIRQVTMRERELYVDVHSDVSSFHYERRR